MSVANVFKFSVVQALDWFLYYFYFLKLKSVRKYFTIILSLWMIESILWAMVKTVQCLKQLFMVSWTSLSVLLNLFQNYWLENRKLEKSLKKIVYFKSTLAVASSISNILEFLSNALAKQTSCLSPMNSA